LFSLPPSQEGIKLLSLVKTGSALFRRMAGSVAWHLNFFYRKDIPFSVLAGKQMFTHKFWKIALLIFAIAFQLAETAYASNHDCCDDAAPCCAMMTSSKTCSPCVSPCLTETYTVPSDAHDVRTRNYSLSITYHSLHLHVIWRPPIE
jgi:hypothetical protein